MLPALLLLPSALADDFCLQQCEAHRAVAHHARLRDGAAAVAPPATSGSKYRNGVVE
jgi:hypothetical protein